MYKFIGKENWSHRMPPPSLLKYDEQSAREVIVTRGCLFFYETQITTMGDVRQHFTDSAIEKLIHDGFLKIKD
jgi:hypothetical protein